MKARILIQIGLLLLAFGAGFFAGVYTLPILVEARNASSPVTVPETTQGDRNGIFVRDLPGSDVAHYGEGDIRLSRDQLVFEKNVTLTPGPDYRVYLTKSFADTKSKFLTIKASAIEVGKMKVFSGPLVFDLPDGIDIDAYDNVLVWCEAFSMFITSARLD